MPPARRARWTRTIAAAIAALTAAAPVAAQTFLPFESIDKGMRGRGLTVFEGTRVEEFPVEVIGLLPNIAPGRNLFLIRLGGDRIERTGVAAGMSGSPIYLEGKLAGALAYTWGFSTEAIAGVTPIHEMLDLLAGAGITPAAPAAAAPISTLFFPERLTAFFDRYLDRRPTGGGMPTAPVLPLPLAVSGADLASLPALATGLRRAGLVPLPAAAPPAAAAAEGGDPGRLEPGAAVAVKLARGDLDISAIGTVTHVDGDRVLAFGHPLLNLGSTDLPMARAEVQAILPSLQSSFKFARPLNEVGSFRQDRAAGLAGTTGRETRLVPIRLEMELPGSPAREFRFELIRTPYLSPYLLYLGLNAILSSAWKEFGEASVEIQDGSTILIAGAEENVALRNLFAGPSSPYMASATIAFIYHILVSNEYGPADVTGINLRLGYRAEPRIARIDRVWVDRGTVRPGETITLSVALRPYRQPGITLTLDIAIPEETPPGRLLFRVGDGLRLSRRENSTTFSPPRDLDQLVRLINHLRTNDKVYVQLTREGDETMIRGERFSHLPPSKASILLEPQVNEDLLRLRERRIGEESIETGFVVSGHRLLAVEVR